MKRTALAILLALFTLTSARLLAQEPLTNESVIKLVGSGIGDELVIQMIRSQPGKYSIEPDAIVRLKSSGVSEKIISAMVARMSGTSTGTSSAGASSPTSAYPSEVGVYYRKEGVWTKLLPEVVNWKTGGVLKTISTVGIVKGDINGSVAGRASRTTAGKPLEIVVCTQEGVEITEYQLLKLRQNKDSREFRTVTGGILHTSGGAKRDLLQYESTEVENRKHLIRLNDLPPGEYGILPPGAVSASNASAQLGKLHTFSIPEK